MEEHGANDRKHADPLAQPPLSMKCVKSSERVKIYLDTDRYEADGQVRMPKEAKPYSL